MFCETRLFTEKFLRTTTIHPRIFGWRALWTDCVSPRMNTIVSRDQFKPIGIGENLVVNYNAWYLTRVRLLSTISEISWKMMRDTIKNSKKLMKFFINFLLSRRYIPSLVLLVTLCNTRRFLFDQIFHNFRSEGRWYQNVLETFPANPKIVAFPKFEAFNGK